MTVLPCLGDGDIRLGLYPRRESVRASNFQRKGARTCDSSPRSTWLHRRATSETSSTSSAVLPALRSWEGVLGTSAGYSGSGGRLARAEWSPTASPARPLTSRCTHGHLRDRLFWRRCRSKARQFAARLGRRIIAASCTAGAAASTRAACAPRDAVPTYFFHPFLAIRTLRSSARSVRVPRMVAVYPSPTLTNATFANFFPLPAFVAAISAFIP